MMCWSCVTGSGTRLGLPSWLGFGVWASGNGVTLCFFKNFKVAGFWLSRTCSNFEISLDGARKRMPITYQRRSEGTFGKIAQHQM